MARTIADVLDRRTRARLQGRDDSATAARAVAALIGPELGWTADDAERQIAEYIASVEHERASGELPLTHLADAR